MTTHRLDTVTLAKKEQLYKVGQDDNNEFIIEPVHRLEAALKMSSNFRQFSNFHFKVYVESSDDRYFYETIYKSLRTFFQKNRNEKNYYFTINNESFIIISNRYQLSFYSVSTCKKGGGGCDAVIKCIERDLNTINDDNQ
jgi:hypothetical protein